MENSDIPIQNGGPGEHDIFITNGGDCRVGPVFDSRTKLDETSFESKVYYLPTLRTTSYLGWFVSINLTFQFKDFDFDFFYLLQ